MTTRITKTWFVDGKIIEQEIPEADIYRQETLRLAELCEGSANAGSTEPWTRRQAAAELRRMHDLLTRAENEMRYAGWDKFEADNTARNGVYEQVKQFLEKST